MPRNNAPLRLHGLNSCALPAGSTGLPSLIHPWNIAKMNRRIETAIYTYFLQLVLALALLARLLRFCVQAAGDNGCAHLTRS